MQGDVVQGNEFCAESSEINTVRKRIKVSKKIGSSDSKSPSCLFKFIKHNHPLSKNKNCTESENTFPETQTHAAHIRTTSDQIRSNDKAVKTTKFNSGVISQVMQKCRLSPSRMEQISAVSSKEKQLSTTPITCPTHIIKKVYFALTKYKNISEKSKNCSFCAEKNVRNLIYLQLYNKYEESTQNIYNVNMVNDVISNANTQLVISFKENLLYDDATEFLKAYYGHRLSSNKLSSIAYLNSKKIIPSFAALKERQYISKNMAKKEKLWKARQASKEKIPLGEGRLFSKKFLEEITVHCSKSKVKNSLEHLLEDFINKDSLSMIRKADIEVPENKEEGIKKKPVVLKGNNLCGLKANLLKKNAYRRHESQKEIRDGNSMSGRMTSTENYSSKMSFKEISSPKRLVLSNSKPIPYSKKGLALKASPLDSLKSGLVFNKEKQRSETPQSCTATHKFHTKEKKHYEGSEYQLDRPVFNSYGKIKVREESEGSARSLIRHGENVSADTKLGFHKKETNTASVKVMKLKGKESKVALQQEKKPILKHLYKSIKDLLAPVGSCRRVASPGNGVSKHKKKPVITKKHTHKCSSIEKELLKISAAKKRK